MVDDGSGSTGKGTTRELIEMSAGVHNGREQLGYTATLNVETLACKKNEGPTEQKSNMYLCSHAFIDDFSPKEPLNNVTLRQLTGGNNLTAARKNGAELVFKFPGQLILFCNGPWRPVEPFIGSDRRRHAGLTYSVRFVDNPTGMNEMRKDSSIKTNLAKYFAEFWFLARVFWLVPRPRPSADRTLPLCPNAASLILTLMSEQEKISLEVTEAMVTGFIVSCLKEYTLAAEKPSSATELLRRFSQYLRTEHNMPADEETTRKALETKLFYKLGYSLSQAGQRKKTTVNVFMLNNRVMTLEEAVVPT
jgi:hypothetical protein